MANVLHVAGFFDPSGDVARSVAELNKHSVHKHEALVHFYHPAKEVMQLPEPEGQNRDNAYVKEKFAWADAIIFHLVGWNHQQGYKIKPTVPCAFRNANVEFFSGTTAEAPLDRKKGQFFCLLSFFANPKDPMYKMVASCHMGARDFMGEDTAFLPALMPIHDPLYLPNWSEREECIAYIKNEALVMSHFGNFTVSQSNVVLDPPQYLPDGYRRRLYLGKMAHHEVMAKRRQYATLAIDNLTEGHYGLAGTESLSQGIPAIAWSHPRTLEQLEHIAPGVGSPFIQADSVAAAANIFRTHVSSDEERFNCRIWIAQYYDSAYLIERYWDPFCDRLIKQ